MTGHVSKVIDCRGREVTLTWIKLDKASDLTGCSPLTQAYGILFDDKGKILILDQAGDGNWTLPGGTIEKGESPIKTLIREVKKEADAIITDIKLLGVQKVEDPWHENPDYKFHYQTRFVAKISELLPQTIDPAKNRIHERRFVYPNEANNYVKWGITGEAMFNDAYLES